MKPPSNMRGNWALNVFIASLATLMFVNLPQQDASSGWLPSIPWWALAGLFYLAEFFLVHLHFRRENHSFSLSEIPLVLGLFFATPRALVLGQLVGAILALGIHRRQRPVKLAFNLGQMTLGAGIAASIFQAVAYPGTPMGPRGWAAAMLATLVITILSSFWIALAIVFAGGQSLVDILHQSLGRAVVVTVCNTSIGLIAAQTIGMDRRAFWLLIVPVAAMVLFYRIYRTERQERSELEFLSGLSSQLHSSKDLGEGLISLLSSLREILRSEVAEANISAGESRTIHLTRVGPSGNNYVTEEIQLTPDQTRLAISTKPLFLPKGSANGMAAALTERGLRDALVAPIYNELGFAGTILLGNREGDVDTFFPEDLRLLETTANLTGVWLQSAKLSAAVKGSEERFRSLVQNSSDVITVVSSEGNIVYQSPSVERILGYKFEDLAATSILDIVHPEDVEAVENGMRSPVQEELHPQVTACRIRHVDGSYRSCEVTIKNLLDDPAIEGVVLNIRDISERRQLEEQLLHQAFHDPLTGLANRVLFIDRIEHALARATREEGKLAVTFLDLDDFKDINDSLGHVAGDELLRTVADRLRSTLRPGDTSSRLGGDEFGILMEEISKPDVEQAISRVLSKIREPLSVQGKEITTQASAGVATNVFATMTAGELLRSADVAMYVAKRNRPGSFEIFRSEMDATMHSRLQLKSDLEQAIVNGEFILHYQPILSLELGGIVGVEALMRWNHEVDPAKGSHSFENRW